MHKNNNHKPDKSASSVLPATCPLVPALPRPLFAFPLPRFLASSLPPLSFSLIVFLVLTILPPSLHADVFLYNEKDTVLGRTGTYQTVADESLIEIARNFNIGYNAIAAVNPDVDAFVPGPPGTRVILPMQWIVPEAQKNSTVIMINLSEYRLYYFFLKSGTRYIATYPVGIGDEGKNTPLGSFSIREKLAKPVWVPPPSVRQEDPALPRIVPSGPENPLGSHALRLSLGSVLIHGTHRPFGVGRRVSHGCIRLYPEDIPMLYRVVPVGTRVVIVRQPVKIGKKDGRIYLEAHDDPEFKLDYLSETQRLLKKNHVDGQADIVKIRAVLETRNGIPADITRDETDEE